MNKGALGLIDVYSYLGAIEAADKALKAANVKLIDCEIVKGGLVTVKIQGDVSSVEVAIAAAEAAITKLEILVVAHVITRPDLSVWNIVMQDKNTDKVTCNHKKDKEALFPCNNKKTENIKQEEKIQAINKIELENNISKVSEDLKEQLESKKVYELRNLARNLNLKNMTKKDINFAKKNTLIEEIILFYEKRDE